MTDAVLTLDDLVHGLERDGTRYQALDVFAANVQQLRDALSGGALGDLQRVPATPPVRAAFVFRRNGTGYQLKVHESGIARLSRQATGPLGLSDEQVALGAIGAALLSGKDLPGMLLGFLVGAALGESPDSPRRVLTIRYSAEERRWRAYDGPLAKWMRDQSLMADPALG